MQKNIKELETRVYPNDFKPTSEQIKSLAHRLSPKIKEFFADEKNQKALEKWKSRKDSKIRTIDKPKLTVL